MLTNYVKNIQEATPLSETAFCGDVGDMFDRFIENRISSDFAINEILIKEAETVFFDRSDDKDAPLGRWRGEFWGKLIISACRAAKYKNSERIREIVRNSAKRIISTADESGYIGSYKDPTLVLPCPRDLGGQFTGWPCEWCWNIWSRKYTLWGMLEAYMLLGDQEILDAAKKSTNQLIDMLDELGLHICETGTFFGVASGSILKPVLILYRLTEDKRYLDFALKIADGFEGGADCNHIISSALKMLPPHLWTCMEFADATDYYKAIGHKAYETMSCFDGILELYRITGEEKYLKATENFWDLLIKYELNPLMSVGFNDIFLFARSQLDAVSEPCDVIHFLRITTELFKLTGNKKYIDMVELSFENALVAGMDRDGKWGARALRGNSWHVHGERQSYCKLNHCCVDNLPRGFLNVAEMIATTREGEIYVNLYTPSKISSEKVDIQISEGYLQYQKLDIKIDAKTDMYVNFRLPAWSKSFVLNGNPQNCENGYCRVAVPCGEGRFTLEFDHNLRVIEDSDHRLREIYPLTDYMYSRLIRANAENTEIIPLKEKKASVKEERAFLMVGPLLLAKCKQTGCSFDEMFNSSSIYGKGYDLKIEAAPNENVRAAFKLQYDSDEGAKELTVCDYAWAGNLNEEEMFSIYF